MTREDIARYLRDRTGNTIKESREIVEHVLEAIVKGLIKDKKVELRGLGTWTVRTRRARKAHKPRTLETIQLPERKVPFFRAAKKLKEAVNDDSRRSEDHQNPEGRD